MAEIHIATLQQQSEVLATLTAAFTTDPLMRWFLPGDSQYQQYFPKLISAFAGGSFSSHSAYCSDCRRGAALWLPPGIQPDEEKTGELMMASMTTSRLAEADQLMDLLSLYEPKTPYWYLPSIGVVPAAQGQNLGSKLLQAHLTQLDKCGEAAYLESSNPRNISLYQRHGFQISGEARIGDSPVVTAMYRA